MAASSAHDSSPLACGPTASGEHEKARPHANAQADAAGISHPHGAESADAIAASHGGSTDEKAPASGAPNASAAQSMQSKNRRNSIDFMLARRHSPARSSGSSMFAAGVAVFRGVAAQDIVLPDLRFCEQDAHAPVRFEVRK